MALSLSSYRKNIILAKELSKKINSSNIKILDCRWYLNKPEKALVEFNTSHLPNSIFFDIEKLSDNESENPHMLPHVSTFNSFISNHNIRKNDFIVFYDQNGYFSSSRVWFTFKYFKFKNLRILDGGFSNWIKMKYPTTSKTTKRKSSNTKMKFNPKCVISKSQIEYKMSNNEDTVIIDARPRKRFLGITPEPRKNLRGGNINGSINVPFDEISQKNGKLRSINELDKLFGFLKQKGMNQEIICSCGSGITACNLIFVLNILGYKNLKLYDGSWAEWGKK